MKYYLLFGLLTLYFVWWRFALVTVGSASIPYFVWHRHRWKQLRCQLNIQRLYEEYTILWFEFDLCALQHRRDATDPTLDNGTVSERKLQGQEQVRDNITGWYHTTDHIVRITHWRWYLPDKNQERVQIHNLLQELIQRKIYVKYTLPVGKYSHRNRMKYLFKKLFNILRIWKVNIFIIMFLVWMSLQQRIIWKILS